MLTFKNKLKNSLGWHGESSTGFSVIEMVIVVPLIAIMAFFLSYIGIYHFQTFNSQSAELNITDYARTALDDIDNYVRQATRVLSSYSTYTTGTNTLVLQIPSIDSSGQLVAGTYDNAVFYLSGTDLFRRIYPDASSTRSNVIQKLASGVNTSNFSFSYDNGDYSLVKQVTTNLTVTQNAGTQVRSITISSQSKLRNF